MIRFAWLFCALAFALVDPSPPHTEAAERPNIVLILIDDLGYGDLGCFGSETIQTPRIDRLADHGTRFTSFYAQPVCGPSRSSLLTGRYPVRSKGWHMPASEVTFAELLKPAGYTTGIVGKWDVSSERDTVGRVPNDQGFDYFWGTLGSNNEGSVTIYDNRERMGEVRDMGSLTRRYTDRAIEFVRSNRERPFLLYLCHSMVHSMIDAGPEFRGRSGGGLYGDCVEELDHHTGRLLDTIAELGLTENTLVIVTSDNGPWNNMKEELREKHGGAVAWGSAGPLRGGKGTTFEGGVRVPCVVRWPGRVPPARSTDAIVATIDLLPTFAALAGCPVPDDRPIDGVDQSELLLGDREIGQRDEFWYFNRQNLNAIRRGKWKLSLPGQVHFGYADDRGSGGLELYDLESDPSERFNLVSTYPIIVKQLWDLAAGARHSFGSDEPLPTPARSGTSYNRVEPLGDLRFDFEAGDLQGWRIVEGELETPVTGRANFHTLPDVPWNKQGRYFLSTLEAKEGARDRTQVAVLESPVFRMNDGRMSFLVGGGQHADTLLCTVERAALASIAWNRLSGVRICELRQRVGDDHGVSAMELGPGVPVVEEDRQISGVFVRLDAKGVDEPEISPLGEGAKVGAGLEIDVAQPHRSRRY